MRDSIHQTRWSHECDPYNYCLGNWAGVLLPPFNQFRAVSEVELPEAVSG